MTLAASSGIISTFWLGEVAMRLQRLDVVVGDEVVDGLHVARGDGVADHLRRLGFGLGRALARLGIAERGFAPALGLQHLRLLVALGLQDRGLALALGLEDRGALLALGLHLPAHRFDQVLGRDRCP